MGNAAYPMPARGQKLMVSFGLVNVGVKYAPIVPDKTGRLSGKFLDPDSHLPVTQQYVNDKGQVVKKVTGYPHGDGFVVPDPEDVKALELQRDTHLQVKAFVPVDEVDPLYLEKAYLVWPDKGHEEGYDLLCEALAETGKALIGTTVIRKSTVAIMLRYAFGCLIAHACTYDDRIAWGDHKLVTLARSERPEPQAEAVEMARSIFSSLPGEFDFSEVHDEFDARLRAMVAALAEGREVERPKEEPAPEVGVDLMAALRESVAAAAEARSKPEPKKRTRKKAAA